MRIHIIRVLALVIVCVVLHSTEQRQEKPTEFQVKVLTEDATPLVGAIISAEFYAKSEMVPYQAVTDEKGCATITGASIGMARYNVCVNGYYPSRRDLEDLFAFEGGNKPDAMVTEYKQSDTIVLRKKKNPVAMYGLICEYMKIPAVNEKIAWDFTKKDWVNPYGKGKTAHVFFEVINEFSSSEHYTLKLNISFADEESGLLAFEEKRTDYDSVFAFAYEAPEEGYVNTLTIDYSQGEKAVPDVLKNYYLKIYDASSDAYWYGKMVDGIRLFPKWEYTRDAHINMKYYINPTGSRNIECDMRKKGDLYKVRGTGYLRKIVPKGMDIVYEP